MNIYKFSTYEINFVMIFFGSVRYEKIFLNIILITEFVFFSHSSINVISSWNLTRMWKICKCSSSNVFIFFEIFTIFSILTKYHPWQLFPGVVTFFRKKRKEKLLSPLAPRQSPSLLCHGDFPSPPSRCFSSSSLSLPPCPS